MLSNTALYAVQATGELARLGENEYVGAAQVAERIGAPPNYLGKLLQTLTQHEVVLSRKGTGGGFRLAREPGDISLYDVVEPIDRVSRWNGCFLGNACRGDEKGCPIHHRWAPVRRAYMNLLNTSTVAEIARDNRGVAPLMTAAFPAGNAGKAGKAEV